MSYQRPIFDVGKRYRVKKAFATPISTFEQGEVLEFELGTFSHYDNCFVYTFRSEITGELKDWLLYESEPIGSWHSFFEVIR